MSSDAAKRAAARRAKIMARGNAGLAKLAQTARGDEAQKLYGDDMELSVSAASTPAASSPATASTTSKPAAQATTSAPATQATQSTAAPRTTRSAADEGRSLTPSAAARGKPSWAADPAAASGAATPSEAEEQARQQMEAMMAMLGGGPSAPGAGAGAGRGPGEMPDMAAMFAQMMQGMQGMPGAGGADGEMPNPFAALQGMGGGGMGGAGGGGMPPGFPGMGGMGMPGMGMPEAPPSKAARRFPLLHALVIVALIVFIAVWWEPNLHMVRAGDMAARTVGDWARRWAGLAGDVGNTSMVEKMVSLTSGERRERELPRGKGRLPSQSSAGSRVFHAGRDPRGSLSGAAQHGDSRTACPLSLAALTALVFLSATPPLLTEVPWYRTLTRSRSSGPSSPSRCCCSRHARPSSAPARACTRCSPTLSRCCRRRRSAPCAPAPRRSPPWDRRTATDACSCSGSAWRSSGPSGGPG